MKNKVLRHLLEEYVRQDITAPEAYTQYINFVAQTDHKPVLKQRSFYNAFYKAKNEHKGKPKAPFKFTNQYKPLKPNQQTYDVEYKIFGIPIFTKTIRT
jgi:hypothetical protein